MKPNGSTVVVLGILGQMPFAGVAWQALQYLEGLRRIGFDVYYYEDTAVWPGDPDQTTAEEGIANTVRYIGRMMEWAGFAGRWAYRAPMPGSPLYGMDQSALAQVLHRADAIMNVTASAVLSESLLRVPVRIYLETDPVLPQIEIAMNNQRTIDLLSAHTHHFTYGENLGQSDCGVPVGRFDYQPTRPPMILEWWQCDSLPPANAAFTTIASWKQSGKDIEFAGQSYRWSKHWEFLRFIDLPRRVTDRFELALASIDEHDLATLRGNGWEVSGALPLSRDIVPYRSYIQQSRGEFTVAKDQNIRLRSGWFSDRSASYLAAGRPVITQETGFSKFLPTGQGLFGFSGEQDIIAALDIIRRDYSAACRAAKGIALSHLRAETVLSRIMAHCGF